MENSNEFNFIKSKKYNGFKELGEKNKFVKFLKISGIIIVLGGVFAGGFLLDKHNVFPFEKKASEKQTESKIVNNTTINTLNLEEFSKASESVAEKVLPSIVGIEVNHSTESIFSGSGISKALGSGIILSTDGYILTNSHVVTPDSSTPFNITTQTNINVVLNNDEKVKAEVIGIDGLTDLAILKIDKKDLKAATLGNSDEIKIGQFVMAIGSPLGLNGSVTSGIISSTKRKIPLSDSTSLNAIQTDASINQGNSGGALVNIKGEVIGINTLKFAGAGVEGIGFAIPINQTKKITDDLIKHKKVLRPSLGIEGSSLTKELANLLSVEKGVVVQNVLPNGAAAKAGILKADVITKFNGKEVNSISDINNEKLNVPEDKEIEIELVRNKQPMTIKLKLSILETKEEPKEEKPKENKKPNRFDFSELFR